MTARPVIFQLLPSLGIGGVEQGAVDMAEALVRAGGRALVASDGGALLPQLRYVGGEHCHFPVPKTWAPWVFYRKVRAFQEILRRNKVQLVHARSRMPAWVAAVACQRERVPLVTTWHGVHQARSRVKRYYNSGLLKGEKVIAVSSHIADRLRSEYQVSDARLVTIARGSDAARFNPQRVNGTRIQALLDRWHVQDETPVIMLPGRMTEWKGHAVLVDALGQLASDHPHLSWVCVLAGPETDPAFARHVYHRACQWGIAERLRFVGPCEDMPAAYALAHMTVVPSCRPEPFGRVAVEAQMMGCPVIGTAQGGLMETIVPDQTGLLVPPRDRHSLGRAIVRLLTADEYDISEMSQRARAHACSLYTKQHMQRATLGVYDTLLGSTLQQQFDEQEDQTEAHDGE